MLVFAETELGNSFGCLLYESFVVAQQHMTYFEQIKLTDQNWTSTERIGGEHTNIFAAPKIRLGY